MKNLILCCLLLFAVIHVSGNNDLRVGDPRNSWWTSQGTIENASLTVRPKGLFLEYGLYMTFSSKGSNWTSAQDTLEVTLNFDLPENAILTDSWLWIGDDIIKAKIMDKWTASTIYENIVRRRRDPSIILKQSPTHYELRVFPMVGNQTRRVKITYLMPTTWSKSHVLAALPTAILNTSLNKPANFPIITWADTTWTNPRIINDNDIIFEPKKNATFGDYHEAVIPSSMYNGNVSIGFDAPLENGIYFSPWQQGNEGIYQLAIFPDQFSSSTVSKKAAILIDYDASNTNITANELLKMVKGEMLMNLSARDSFNLLFSNLTIARYSEKWVAASKTNIEDAFASLNNPLSSYSNLGTLLVDGIDFVKENGHDGKIVLISDGDQYVDYQVANTLINDLIKRMDSKIPVHVTDYQSISFTDYYLGGKYYFGNDYFYSNLSRMTLGSYHAIKTNEISISESINRSLKYLGGSITSFDLHTSLKTGFCHSRYTMTSKNNSAYVNEAILQVGKFKGEFPFLIEISGEYNNEVFSERIEIQQPSVFQKDTVSEIIWTGQYIKGLESGSQSNEIINEIIYSSISERVLSKYTSFLCLEDTNYICNDCVDESKVTTSAKEVIAGQDSLVVFPNPFVEKITIDLMCSNVNVVKELSIVDVTGSLVYRFETGQLNKGRNVISWNGFSARGERVKAGVYLLVYKTSGYVKTVKIVRK